ncbi:MAG: SWIM zinc finger family protein [Candidatus Aureabacteria bacterium]|nr:SWIM zinc finger family protein [Candidatus Auribacterota bacterium]
MYWRYGYFTPSKPRAVRGGIKAQSGRRAVGKNWWAERWNAVLEELYAGNRLTRGRSYARRGQVLRIDIEKGMVKGQVQGSRSRPYDISIRVKVMSKPGWKKVVKTLSEKSLFTAKLLAGEMPQDIEEVFKKAGLSLFPERGNDLKTECSCPDWANPCKHIAAVYYLLGEEFDRDPFLIFKLRGMSRKEFVNLLSHISKTAGAPKACEMAKSLDGHAEVSSTDEPISSDLKTYWDGGEIPDDLFGEVSIPRVPAALPKRLGSFPFWRGEERFLEAIEPIYEAASPRGLDTYIGEYTMAVAEDNAPT